jgi:hypothetical protein
MASQNTVVIKSLNGIKVLPTLPLKDLYPSTKELISQIPLPDEIEHGSVNLKEPINAYERCKLSININSKKKPSNIQYSIVCEDSYFGLVHHISEITENGFKLNIENQTQYVRQIRIDYLVFF